MTSKGLEVNSALSTTFEREYLESEKEAGDFQNIHKMKYHFEALHDPNASKRYMWTRRYKHKILKTVFHYLA